MWYRPFQQLPCYLSPVGLECHSPHAVDGRRIPLDFKKVGLDWLNIRSTISGMSLKLNAKALSELPTCSDICTHKFRDPTRAQRMKQALPTYRKASKEPESLPTILLDWQPYLMKIMGKGKL